MQFSVIVPVYNVEQYLEECLISILNQTFNDFELILVDDGSTDSSGKICDSFARKDKHISVIHTANSGLSAARNTGILKANGDYLVFLDSDDFFYTNDALSLIHADIVKSHADIVAYKTCRCDSNGNNVFLTTFTYDKYPEDVSLNDFLKDAVKSDDFQASAWSKVVKRSIIVENNLFFKEKLLGEDIDWYISVVRIAKTISLLDQYIYVYRKRPNSITTSFGVKNLTDLIWILNKWDKLLTDTSVDASLKNYLGKNFVSLLIVYASIDKKVAKEHKKEVKQLRHYLEYDSNKRTKKVRLFYKLFGFNCTIALLRLLLKIKNGK